MKNQQQLLVFHSHCHSRNCKLCLILKIPRWQQKNIQSTKLFNWCDKSDYIKPCMLKYNYHLPCRRLVKRRREKNSNIFRSTWLCFFFVSGIPGCGGLLTAPNGQFSSPQHPETYANNLDCEWLIRVPQGDRIELNFLSFDLERHTTCLWVLQLNLVFLMWIRQIVLQKKVSTKLSLCSFCFFLKVWFCVHTGWRFDWFAINW